MKDFLWVSILNLFITFLKSSFTSSMDFSIRLAVIRSLFQMRMDTLVIRWRRLWLGLIKIYLLNFSLSKFIVCVFQVFWNCPYKFLKYSLRFFMLRFRFKKLRTYSKRIKRLPEQARFSSIMQHIFLFHNLVNSKNSIHFCFFLSSQATEHFLFFD